jgi:pyrroline-5-carboxylate reductase
MTQLPSFPVPTWMAGCGNMGGAMIEGWRVAGLDVSQLVVIRPSAKAVEGVRTVSTFAEAGPPPKLVILAFKPQQLDAVAAQLKTWLTSKTAIVSILAGTEVASLRARFPKAGPIFRALPNLPVAIRRGVVGLYTDETDEAARKPIAELFAPLGFAMWMADEAKLAALGAIGGAGPAYVARFIAALAKAGEERGLSREISATVALETVLGTAWMAATNGEAMDALARRVASPNGTTEAGLAVLDKEQVLDQLVGLTIEAAARRGAELAAEARAPA